MSFRYIFTLNWCRGLLVHGLSWTSLPSTDLSLLVHLSIIKKFFLCHCQMLNITLMDFDDSSSDSFFAPSWSEYCLFSFSGSTVLPPGGQLFKECQEMLMSFFIRDFANLVNFLPCLTILFWNQLSYSKDHVYPKSSCWKGMLVFLKVFS
jgi:hypothetical protein